MEDNTFTEYNDGRNLQQSRLKEYGHKRISRSSRKRARIDVPFCVLTIVILAIGVIMVLSASFARSYYTIGDPIYYFMRQMIFAVSGVALMLIVSRIKVSTFRRFSYPLLAVSILLLAVVPFIGVSEGDVTRWISLGFTTFQPSEITKLAEVLAFAAMICTYKDRMKTFRYGVLPFAVVVAVIVGLLYMEPHLSAAVIIFAIAVLMMFAGGTRMGWFALLGGVVLVLGILTLTKFGYASDRIAAWRHPEEDPMNKGFQILQSLYAIGSGGLTGLGLGQGRQKYLYLPAEHNDYIFAIVCEELGFIGAMLVLILFALLIIRGFWIALHANDRYGSLVATGLTGLLAIQVFLNIAVVTNLIPCTGISLPFFSYGGTALWIQMIEMGVILAISREIPVSKEEDEQ